MSDSAPRTGDPKAISKRFRGFLPVVIDVETGGFNSATDALLEMAATLVGLDADGKMYKKYTCHFHITPFEGANLEPASLEVNKIDPFHPLRIAVDEKEALQDMFEFVREEMRLTDCKRAILVGHNAWFDLSFLNAAIERCKIKRSPFHPFSSFDTATLGGALYGQTVLRHAANAAGMEWSNDEAHSAKYDTEQTAELFCRMINLCQPAYESVVGEKLTD